MNIHEDSPRYRLPSFGEEVGDVLSEARLPYGERHDAQVLILESAFVISTLIKQGLEISTHTSSEKPNLLDFLRQNISRILDNPDLENQIGAFREHQAEKGQELRSKIPFHPRPDPATGVFE
jgi:hypothetical protein